MCNAVWDLAQRTDLPDAKYLILNTDCRPAMHKIRTKSGDLAVTLCKLIEEVRKKTCLPVFELRHVKAHNGTPDSRSFINDWCDTHAKKAMRSQNEKRTKRPPKGVNKK